MIFSAGRQTALLLMAVLSVRISDVTKLFKIRIRRMRISTSEIRRIRMRMRISLDKALYHSECNTLIYVKNGCDNMLFANVSISSIQINII